MVETREPAESGRHRRSLSDHTASTLRKQSVSRNGPRLSGPKTCCISLLPIAVMKTINKSNLVRNGLLCLIAYDPSLKEVRARTRTQEFGGRH